MSDREKAIRVITEKLGRGPRGTYHERQIFKEFGAHVFDEMVQREMLSTEVFEALRNTVKMGTPLDSALADPIAAAMKRWALERGATHFCHWFQPLTDLTAEKHDSFFIPSSHGEVFAGFNGKDLIAGEPDASSFPSGGLRTTFEARGYTAWDPSSPAFLLGRTLVIPTYFMSWTGEALDKKTPLQRSMDVLNKQALRILNLFGNTDVQRVLPMVGAEQEYFLIDRHFYNLRPDLLCSGRTLFGARPPKGQELEDQYLGAIPDRIIGVMEELEFELLRLGIPIKTRHNEVAPSQFEIALTFQAASLAADHHMLVMEILKRIAQRHGMVALFHEKPFAGINGSGKHCNWSLATDLGENLLDPGETPHENARFLLLCAAVARAVHQYASLLRMSVASAGNDHRLGIHEAPPGIMSLFLGAQLTEIFQCLMNGEVRGSKKGGELRLGISMLPPIPRHTSDRNRTSPFAFTGDKFEFRAVGSTQNIATPIMVLNTIVAESLDTFATELERADDFNEALHALLARELQFFQPILFEGDNYGTEWQKEAARRGLPNIRDTVTAAQHYTSRESVALFNKYKVLSRRELESLEEIMLGKYVKKVLIEGRTASNLVHTVIVPAALRYVNEIGGALTRLNKSDQALLKNVTKEFSKLREALKGLDEVLARIPQEELVERASYMRDKVLPAMAALRTHVDALELQLADSLWPLPKYYEMLFIR